MAMMTRSKAKNFQGTDTKDTKSGGVKETKSGGGMDTTKDVSTEWRKGIFQLVFFSMGQGDCCVVTSPDGDHVMIDCGSKKLEAADALKNIQELLRSKDVLNLQGSKKGYLEALILTHPDKDHISCVTEIVRGETDNKGESFNEVTVKKVYFSDPKAGREDFRKSPLRYYGCNSCASTLYFYAGVERIFCVTLRTGAKALDMWKRPFGEQDHVDASQLISNNRVTVAAGKDWEISIIAGNVVREQSDKSDTDGRNAASLVTLVRHGDDTALICGDATLSTENYLYNTFKNANDIKRVYLLQAPHHGSGVTSSSKDFVSLVNPQRVIVSVETNEHAHHLPGKGPISSYTKTTIADVKHPSACWHSVTAQLFYESKDDWSAKKGKGQINFVEEFDNQWRLARYMRSGVGDSFDGWLIIDGFNAQTKFMLYQTPLEKNIRQTGRDRHRRYLFP